MSAAVELEANRLEQLRLTALEACIDADLELAAMQFWFRNFGGYVCPPIAGAESLDRLANGLGEW